MNQTTKSFGVAVDGVLWARNGGDGIKEFCKGKKVKSWVGSSWKS